MIEQAKKRTSIFIPSQYDTIITMARKKHPYIVVPLRFNQFYDLQKVAKENYGSFKQTTDGERVNWGKIKIIKIDQKKKTKKNILLCLSTLIMMITIRRLMWRKG